MTETKIPELALRLNQIVEEWKMPEWIAVQLLSSSILYLCEDGDLSTHADAVAHLRLCLGDEWDEASASLAGWLDEVNELLDSPKI